MPEIPSDYPGEASFMAQYMPSFARSGVILNSAFPALDKERDFQILKPYSTPMGFHIPSQTESHSGHFSEDSFEEEEAEKGLLGVNPTTDTMRNLSLSTKGEMPMYDHPASHPEDNVKGPVPVNDDDPKDVLNNPLLRKLEQLKELQLQKQEQLKQQQMEQLQKLMEEQKMLLSLVSRQQGYCEPEQENQPYDSAPQRSSAHIQPPISHQISTNYLYDQQDLNNDGMTSYFKEGCNTASTGEHYCDVSQENDFQSEEENGDFTVVGINEDSSPTLHDHQRYFVQHSDDNSVEAIYTEERPIVSELKERKKSFEEFVEEQMRLEEQRLRQNTPQAPTKTEVKPLTKKPFLKRGEGLARFRSVNPKSKEDVPSLQPKVSDANVNMVEKLQSRRKTVSQEQFFENRSEMLKRPIQTCKDKSEQPRKNAVLKTHNNKNTSVTQGQQESISNRTGKNVIRQEKINVLKANKENVLQRISTKTNADSLTNVRNEEFPLEVSFQKRKKIWEKEKQKENFELDEFLLLEQAAEDISFSSNSSFVQKLLDQNYQIDHGRLSSTPVKQQQIKNVEHNDIIVRKLDPVQGKKGVLGVSKKNQSISHVPQEQKKEDMIESINQEEKSSKFVEQSSSEFKRSLDEYERTREDDSGIVTSSREENPHCDELKGPSKNVKKDNKSRDFDLDLSDRENSDGEESTLLEKKSNCSSEADDSSLLSSNASHIEFDDEKTWTDLDLENQQEFCENSFTNKEFIPSAYTTKSPVIATEKTIKRKVASKKADELLKTNVTTANQSPPPTSDLVIKLFPSLKPKQKPESQFINKPAFLEEDSDPVRSQLLKEKLNELENEIERFKMENASLARLREDKEKTLESLRKEVAEFELQKTKELARIEEMKKEEIKKLQKERKVFEKYASAARAIPDKKEREEIQTLKQQVKDLQEELKSKEVKWSNIKIRLRNQIETLLKENGELREEIKFMEKVRVETWKKSEATESKKKPAETNVNHQRYLDSTIPSNFTEKSKTSPPVSQPEKSIKIMKSHSPGKSMKPSKSSLVCNMSNPEPTKSSDNVLVTEQKSQTPVLKGSEDDVQGEICYSDGKIERILRNGSHVILFPNGTRKEVSADGKSTTVTFFNGDVKQVMADQRVIYYYADAETTHTTYPDGLEILQFSNGQIEKHFPDGKKEITFPDQTIKNLNTDGTEESIFPDGTIITIKPDGSKIIAFDNGQRELHTPQFKRREYPDGTIKTVYNNGQQETKYASGRVRIKDNDGNVLMDTKV
ncbi:centromere protein J isoform X2 [Pelobates fuscus]|uniref:centromere protein J isoform X2 n=1 Tax=Pelobates fuscus TaxID=191477 RepID=UPI002FE4E805